MSTRPRPREILTHGTGQVGALRLGDLGGGPPPIDIFTGEGAPADGPSGTGVLYPRGPGSSYTDTTTGNTYLNIGTAASPVWLLVGGPDAMRLISISLTNAQMLAARATPVELVAAPGAGYWWQLREGTVNFSLAGAYTESSDNLVVRYDNAGGVIASEVIETTGLLDTTGKVHTNILAKKDALATEAQRVNKPLVLHNNGDAEFGGGNAGNVGRITLTVRRVAAL